MSHQDKIASRIAKLLRRAARDDGPEADTAGKLAQRLMDKYGLEVEIHELDPEPTPLVAERLVMVLPSLGRSRWAQFLLQELVKVYSCERRREAVDGQWAFYVTGPPGQVEPVRVHFEYLRRKIELLAAFLFRHHDLMGSEREPLYWGIMDGVLKALGRRLLSRQRQMAPPASTQKASWTVTKIDLLALPADPDALDVRPDAVANLDDIDAKIEPPSPMSLGWAFTEGAEQAISIDPEPPDIVYAPVSKLDVHSRIASILAGAKIRTVAELLRFRPTDLLTLDGIDEGELMAIVEALSEHVLALANEWDEEVV